MNLTRCGRVWLYGDQVDTDQIFPGRFMNIGDPERASKHLFSDLDPAFGQGVALGDLIVAGRNFGLGSTRGQALLAMKAAGIGGIVAESFSRIFFRSCISEGIPVLECPGVSKFVCSGDRITVDFASGTVCNEESGGRLSGLPLEPFILDRLIAGGSLNYLQSTMGAGTGEGSQHR